MLMLSAGRRPTYSSMASQEHLPKVFVALRNARTCRSRGVSHGLARKDGPHMGPIRVLLEILPAGPYRESDRLRMRPG
jgi:hypothetical protein